MKTLEKDVHMLKILNLMDYSLLLCIESNPDYVQALHDGIISARTQHQDDRSSDTKSRNSSRYQPRSCSTVTQDLEFLEMKFVPTRNTFLSADGKHIYHLGIIDYL
mmetsp:Transcript_27989/g.37911  ORF Transcript_27989/g.37911 Transcript_27989/m.37911 type:complete len:106 (+) Transcript_27989:271-588(+)